ncbi:MAG: NepR family anti-sigma factor [Sphingomonadaceae bacterium]|nr:NepR family anti-sigma factor [Sphingomonadaceae bacterium]
MPYRIRNGTVERQNGFVGLKFGRTEAFGRGGQLALVASGNKRSGTVPLRPDGRNSEAAEPLNNDEVAPGISNALHRLYDSVLDEDVPDELRTLLSCLD